MSPNVVCRRRVLKAGAGIVAMPLLASWHRRPARASELSARLVPAPAIVNIVGEKYPSTPVWAYNATVPGPLLRVRRGARLRVTLENGIPDATTIHWHGIRVPNAMDGVPHLTQPPVERAQSFVYEFAAEDAGTYWYHPHWQSHEQVERGLYGALIVDEDEPPRVDRDVLWVLDDWKLSGDAKLVEDFGNFFDVSHAGRLGNTVTVGGKVVDQFRVRSGERLRLRLVNTANARIFALGFGALKPRVIATDGHGIAPHEPERGLVVLGPGMRADLIVDCLGRSGDSVTVTDEFRPQQAYRLVEIVYGDEPPLRDHAPDGPVALAPNLVPSPKLDEAARHQLVFAGGMMGSLREAEMDGRRRPMREIMQHRMAWAVNGKVATGHSHEPILRLQRGRSYRLSLTNDTAWHHPIHLHGHTFKVLSRNGVPLAHDEWRDTVLMNPRDDLEIAFVADNPGDWMLHCHILEHQAGGMMAVVRVS